MSSVPSGRQDPANMREYDEDGIHAYEYRIRGSRLTIFYSEGFGELHGFGGPNAQEEQASFWAKTSSKWMANFFAYILGQPGSVVKWPG